MVGGGMILKVCGITNPEDAAAAIANGATAIGFNFYSSSPRYIAPERAALIATTVLCGLLIAVVAAWDEHLPALVGANGAYTATLLTGNTVGALASIVAAGLAWHRYRRGTIFLTGIATLLLVGQWATIAVLLGLSRYTLPFYSFHVLRAVI